MEKYLTIAAEKTMQGMTVEKLLREYLGLTKKQISRAKFRLNGICKNSIQCRVTEKVSCGDKIQICLETEETQSIHLISDEKAGEKLDILYEDEDVLAVNKPAGVLTHHSGMHRGIKHHHGHIICQIIAVFIRAAYSKAFSAKASALSYLCRTSVPYFSRIVHFDKGHFKKLLRKFL